MMKILKNQYRELRKSEKNVANDIYTDALKKSVKYMFFCKPNGTSS